MKTFSRIQTLANVIVALVVCGAPLAAKTSKPTQSVVTSKKQSETQAHKIKQQTVVNNAKPARTNDIILSPSSAPSDLVFDSMVTRATPSCPPCPANGYNDDGGLKPCPPCSGPQIIKNCETVPVTTPDGKVCMIRNSDGYCVPRTKKVCSVQVNGSCPNFDAKEQFLRIKFSGVGAQPNSPQMALVSLKFEGTITFSSKINSILPSTTFTATCLNYAFPVTFTATDLLISPSMTADDFTSANCAQKGASKICSPYGGACSMVLTAPLRTFNNDEEFSLLTRQASLASECCAVGETKPLLVAPQKACFASLPFDPACDGQGGGHPLSLSVSFNPCTNNANYILLGLYPHADACTPEGCNGGCFNNNPNDDNTCPTPCCDSTCPQPANAPVVPSANNGSSNVCQSIATSIKGTLFYTVSSSSLACGGDGAVACVGANDACKPDALDCLCQLLECGIIDQCQFDCLAAVLKGAEGAGCPGGASPAAQADLAKTLQTLMHFRSGMLRSSIQPDSVLNSLPDDVVLRILEVLEQDATSNE